VASDLNTPVPSSPESSTFSLPQYRFCLGAVRQLKKQKDAAPFLRPVDPIALNIPHYPSIIKTPMDLSTIERKVMSSNPAKPDPNPQNPRYHSADEFISDVRLIFQNCLTFNGPDHAISAMGKRVEQMFDKSIKQMPAAEVGASSIQS
jgi:bromodomain-containing factor 1